MNLFFRAVCVFVYVMAIAKLTGLLPAGQFEHTPLVAGILLVLHALEVVFMMRQVRLYAGPLWQSIVLTLLFGFLHWKPLADRNARTQSGV